MTDKVPALKGLIDINLDSNIYHLIVVGSL